MVKKYVLGIALLFVVLSASVYFILSEEYRIDIRETYSSFKVYENGSWNLAGEERSVLLDGTTRMRASNRVVNFTMQDNITTAYRYAYFKNNITVIDKYVFDGEMDSVEMFPISHEIRVLGAERERPYILLYEVSKLEYFGETDYEIGSAHEFGYNMKVEWSDGNYYERLYKYKNKNEGKLEIKYRVSSDDFSVEVRLFDPIINADSVFTNLIYNEADIDKGVAIFEIKNPVDNLSIDDIYYTYDVVKGSGLRSIEAYVEIVESTKVPTYNYSVNSYECFSFDNETETIINDTCNINIITQNGTEIITTTSWEKVEYLDKGLHKIKLVGYFNKIEHNSLDWFPNVALDKNKYELPKDKFGEVRTLDFKQSKWAWWNSSWIHYKEYTNLTGNITYMFIDAAVSDDANFDETRFLSCYNDTLVFNHTLESTFGTSGQFRVNNLGENCTLRYYNNSAASSISSASDVYFNPVSAWYLDANVNDFVGSNDMSITGALTQDDGYINGSYFWDADGEYMSKSSPTNMPIGASDRTVNMWVYFTGSSISAHSFSYGIFATDRMFQARFIASGKIVLHMGPGGSELVSTNTMSEDAWHMVTFVQDSGTQRIYIDRVANGISTRTLNTGSSTFYIGTSLNAPTEEWRGNIDEVKIYNYALTPDQIIRLYTETAPNFIEGAEQTETPVDTCTYSSGDWEVDCNDNCSISSNVDIGGNNLSLSGVGTFDILANITSFDKILKPIGCQINIWKSLGGGLKK